MLLSPGTAVVRYVAALFPILLVLHAHDRFPLEWSKSGSSGLAPGVVVAALVFGLTFDVFWVSQAKGVVTSGLVLGVLWPALLLYNLVNKAGGIDALARALQQVIPDYGLLLIVLSWAFSGLLEGLAGYGIPIAIVAPMLVSLRVKPVRAVAAVAVGHAWAVTFGDMGVNFPNTHPRCTHGPCFSRFSGGAAVRRLLPGLRTCRDPDTGIARQSESCCDSGADDERDPVWTGGIRDYATGGALAGFQESSLALSLPKSGVCRSPSNSLHDMGSRSGTLVSGKRRLSICPDH